MSSVRGEEDTRDHAGAVDEQRRAQEHGTRRAQGHGRTVALAAMPVLAAASSGIGEHQGGVKGVQTRMVAWFGKVRRPGQRARTEQRLWCTGERVGRMPTPLDEHRHRVNFGIRLS